MEAPRRVVHAAPQTVTRVVRSPQQSYQSRRTEVPDHYYVVKNVKNTRSKVEEEEAKVEEEEEVRTPKKARNSTSQVNAALRQEVESYKADAAMYKNQMESYRADQEEFRASPQKARNSTPPAESQVNTLRREVESHKADAARYRTQMESYRADQEEARTGPKKEVNTLRREVESYKADAARHRNQMESYRADLEKSKSSAARIHLDECDTLKSENVRLQKQMASLCVDYEALGEEHNREKREVELLQERSAELVIMQKQVDGHRREADGHRRLQADFEALVVDHEKTHSQLRREKREVDLLQERSAELVIMQKQVDGHRREVDGHRRLQTDFEALAVDHEKTHSQLRKCQTEIAVLQAHDDCEELLAERNQLCQNLATLSSELGRLQGLGADYFEYAGTCGHQSSHKIQTAVVMDQGNPMLGVEIKMLDDAFGRQDSVVVVHSVIPSGPSQEAGIRCGDILKEWDGIPLDSKLAFSRLVRSSKIGSTVVFTVIRNGRERTTSVMVGAARSNVGNVRRVKSDIQIGSGTRSKSSWSRSG